MRTVRSLVAGCLALGALTMGGTQHVSAETVGPPTIASFTPDIFDRCSPSATITITGTGLQGITGAGLALDQDTRYWGAVSSATESIVTFTVPVLPAAGNYVVFASDGSTSVSSAPATIAATGTCPDPTLTPTITGVTPEQYDRCAPSATVTITGTDLQGTTGAGLATSPKDYWFGTFIEATSTTVTFTVPDVPEAGLYYVFADNGSTSVNSFPVAIEAEACGTVSGMVTSKSGSSVSGEEICAVLPARTYTPNRFCHTTTDTGSYRIDVPFVGTYTMMIGTKSLGKVTIDPGAAETFDAEFDRPKQKQR